jgi:hypothetical protein
MQIGASTFNASALLNLLGKSAVGPASAPDPFKAADASAANPAEQAGGFLPIAQTGGLSFSSILALQSIDAQRDAAEVSPVDKIPDTPEEIFLQESQKTPMERVREQILDQLGLTEDQIAQMAPEERRAAEDQIAKMAEEALRQGMTGDSASAEEQGVGQFVVEVA